MTEIERIENEGALARRLAELHVNGPDRVVARAIERYHAPSRRRPRRAWVLVAAAIATLATVTVASTIALGDGSSRLASLAAMAGIGPRTTDHVQVPTAGGRPLQATSNGHTVTLLGAYGNALQTIVLLQLDVRGRPMDATVTDESGRLPGGDVASQGQDVALVYQALPVGRHTLTLHLTTIVLRPVPGARVVQTIRGDWMLTFPLLVTSDRVAVSPADGQLGGVHVHVNDVAGNGYVLDASVETTGATIDQLMGLPPESREGPRGSGAPAPTVAPDSFKVELIDSRGTPQPLIGQGSVATDKGSAGLSDVNTQTYWTGSGPGSYRLVVTYQGQRFETEFTVR